MVLASSNSGSLVSFGAGTKNVWVDAPAKLLTQAALAVANVQLYGAVGNGSTDDHAAIQAAIDSGLPVYFPAATYAISTGLTVGNNGQSLTGPKGAILKKTAGVDCLTVTGNDNEVRGLTHRRQQPERRQRAGHQGREQLRGRRGEPPQLVRARHLPGRPIDDLRVQPDSRLLLPRQRRRSAFRRTTSPTR